ncbi:abortive phage infection protein [Candidatus Magnetoovum chiemensis]|nr:abortive phage infection protein [Candidatus Magnetoovum chiemensis]
MPSIQDFSLIKTSVNKTKELFNLQDASNAFYFFAIDLILNLQEDEIRDAITDTNYLRKEKRTNGHDRGIDAIFIDSSEQEPTIHIFNFKYTEDFEKTKNNNFPSSEIDKIVVFLNSYLNKDEALIKQKEANTILSSKVQEIWEIFKSESPNFIIHICANYYNGFETKEKLRFEREIKRYSKTDIKYHLMDELVTLKTHKGKNIVNSRIKAIDNNLFLKSNGDIQALIVNVDVRDLIRIVLDDDEIRNKVDLEDYAELKNYKILDDAFEDNVRVYLKQRSRINQNIKKTALSNKNLRIFYFNNGVTLTVSKFNYSTNQRSPIIELRNVQVVNGGQTIHALHEAFLEDTSKFKNMDILCRIYQTENTELSKDIANYTNSQNPVKSRDVRSIDFAQVKLEKEFLEKGYYYERKKNQYMGQSKDKRIDAEKAGQVLMAFFNKMPAEAKNKRNIIFSDKYDEVFNDSITTNDILLCYELFQYIEKEKIKKRKELLSFDNANYEDYNYIIYASYYILYFIGEIAERLSTELTYNNKHILLKYYPIAVKIIEKLIEKEKSDPKKNYEVASFFKQNIPKIIYGQIKDNDDVKTLFDEIK